MASKIHSGGVLGGEAEKNTLFNASRTPQGLLLMSHLGVQNRSKRVSKTPMTSKSVLQQFWDALETDFDVFFEVSA